MTLNIYRWIVLIRGHPSVVFPFCWRKICFVFSDEITRIIYSDKRINGPSLGSYYSHWGFFFLFKDLFSKMEKQSTWIPAMFDDDGSNSKNFHLMIEMNIQNGMFNSKEMAVYEFFSQIWHFPPVRLDWTLANTIIVKIHLLVISIYSRR